MVKISSVAYYLVHPAELRNMIQWAVWHEPVHERDQSKESPELKHCFVHLKNTSRSFAAVIQELHPELLVPVTLFYLALRGLDTIEDDMTLSVEEKEPLLRGFDGVLEKEGWTFNDSGPGEEDRELLVRFDVVVHEFKKLKPEYKAIIKDITKRMGNGMADFVINRDHNLHGVNTVKEYELYCHYVAGLVGEGLTRLFVEAKLANPALLTRKDLHESMGQFLQQTNIIRDVREDHDDKRYFWPKEIWSKHVDTIDELFEAENLDKALACSSEMILHALRRADDCLFDLAGIRDQSVFNFCAIPQSMAIATLELCFQNPAIFQRNVKITKGSACELMLKSTQNLQLVCEVFRTYARRIHKRNNPLDPNFLDISVACGRVETFIESIFPSQTARTIKSGDANAADKAIETEEQQARRRAIEAQDSTNMWVMLGATALVLLSVTGFMLIVAWLFGARFDLAWQQFRGTLTSPSLSSAAAQVTKAVTEAKDEL